MQKPLKKNQTWTRLATSCSFFSNDSAASEPGVWMVSLIRCCLILKICKHILSHSGLLRCHFLPLYGFIYSQSSIRRRRSHLSTFHCLSRNLRKSCIHPPDHFICWDFGLVWHDNQLFCSRHMQICMCSSKAFIVKSCKLLPVKLSHNRDSYVNSNSWSSTSIHLAKPAWERSESEATETNIQVYSLAAEMTLRSVKRGPVRSAKQNATIVKWASKLPCINRPWNLVRGGLDFSQGLSASKTGRSLFSLLHPLFRCVSHSFSWPAPPLESNW